jgi:hypothetical protein
MSCFEVSTEAENAPPEGAAGRADADVNLLR